MAGVNFTCRRHMAVTRLKSRQEAIRACEPFGVVENPEAQGARTALSASPTPAPPHARTKLSALREKGLDGDTVLVSIHPMMEITSKQLHEQTAAMLDRAKRGQRMRVLRNGKPDALLVPADEAIDPSWDEIMADVWAMAKERRGKGIPPRPNPVLEERKRRQKVILKNHARLR